MRTLTLASLPAASAAGGYSGAWAWISLGGLVTTPVGIAGAIYEAYRLAGGLVFLMVALMSLIAVAMGSLVLTIRREARTQEKS